MRIVIAFIHLILLLVSSAMMLSLHADSTHRWTSTLRALKIVHYKLH